MARLQRFVRHQDPRTTQRYFDPLQAEDLENALDLVPELSVGKAFTAEGS